ncbi:MAG TPA: hypothetical protein VNF74_15975 [Terriglobales bacterium]|nr:hypothetical protein [Terriglobales bacterium]
MTDPTPPWFQTSARRRASEAQACRAERWKVAAGKGSAGCHGLHQ